MKFAPLSLAILLTLAPISRADPADDAEAKRRGVPVGQVQAERALAEEKKRTAEAEQHVADLQKTLAELNDKIAQAAEGPSVTLPKDGTPLYDYLVKHYTAGDWSQLAADLAARDKAIAALSADKAADIAYIKQTVAECRPEWWEGIKSGKVTQFKQKVWDQDVAVSFQKSKDAGIRGFSDNAVKIAWPSETMDVREPMSMTEMGMSIGGDYRRADGTDLGIWSMLGTASVATQIGLDKMKSLGPADRKQYDRYVNFWSNLTAAYYGTPSARRMICVLSLASFEQGNNGSPIWEGRRPLGSMLLIETNLHPYRSLNIMPVLGLTPEMGEAEMFQAKVALIGFNGSSPSIADDRALRAALKTFAQANAKWTTEKIELPNNVFYDLDPAKDAALREDRVKATLKPVPPKTP